MTTHAMEYKNKNGSGVVKLMKRLYLILLFVLLAGCATTISPKKLSHLQVGMSKDEVRKILGEPYQFRSAINNQETWEYLVSNPYTTVLGYETYWVTFVNNELYFYGLPGDFGSTTPSPSLEIYEKQDITIKNR